MRCRICLLTTDVLPTLIATCLISERLLAAGLLNSFGDSSTYSTRVEAQVAVKRRHVSYHTGALESVPQGKMDTQGLLSKLRAIDKTLSAVPREDEVSTASGAQMQAYASTLQQQAANVLQGVSQAGLIQPAQQSLSVMNDALANAGGLATGPAGHCESTGRPPVEAPYPVFKTQTAESSLGQTRSRSQSPEPALDVLTSQMEQQSVQLMHHVAMAVTNIPEQSGQQLEVAGWAGAEDVTAMGASQVGMPSIECIGSTIGNPGMARPVHGHQSTQPASPGCIINSLFSRQQVEQPEPTFGSLVTRIRATEMRLQEAILSLTEATQHFKQELPTPVPFSPGILPGARAPSDRSISPSRPATQPHSWAVCRTPQSTRARFSWTGHVACEEAVDDVCAPLGSLGWTPLNPLYPASSRSVSPDSYAPSMNRSQSPEKAARPPMPNFSPRDSAQIAQSPLASPPLPSQGNYDVEAAQQQSRRERDSMFQPSTPVNRPLKPKTSMAGIAGAAMARASKIQLSLADIQAEPPAPAKEGSRSSMARPPNLPVGRPSAVGSMVSESSSWSLDQSAVEDDLLSFPVPEDAIERLSLGPQGLRENYRRRSSKMDPRQFAKVSKLRGSMRVSIHPHASRPLETEAECSVSEAVTEPAESEASEHTGAQTAEACSTRQWHDMYLSAGHNITSLSDS